MHFSWDGNLFYGVSSKKLVKWLISSYGHETSYKTLQNCAFFKCLEFLCSTLWVTSDLSGEFQEHPKNQWFNFYFQRSKFRNQFHSWYQVGWVTNNWIIKLAVWINLIDFCSDFVVAYANLDENCLFREIVSFDYLIFVWIFWWTERDFWTKSD